MCPPDGAARWRCCQVPWFFTRCATWSMRPVTRYALRPARSPVASTNFSTPAMAVYASPQWQAMGVSVSLQGWRTSLRWPLRPRAHRMCNANGNKATVARLVGLPPS